MAVTRITKCLGLWTGPNPQDAPPGALRVASNVMLHRPHLIVPRLGFEEAAGVASRSTSYRPHRLMRLGSDLIISAYDTTNYRLERAGADTQYESANSNATPPDSGDWQVQGANMRDNLYTTSSVGIRKLSTISDSATVAAGLDVTLFEILHFATVAGGTNEEVAIPSPTGPATLCGYAHRYVWVSEDSNGYVRRSAPGARYLTYTAGNHNNAINRVPLPGWVTAGDKLEIYRTLHTEGQSQDDNTPGAEYYLALTYEVTSTDVSNGYTPGYVQGGSPDTGALVDKTPDDSLGAALYTNPSQFGELKAKYPPPIAHCMAKYAGCMWYGNTVEKHRIVVQVIDVAGYDFSVLASPGAAPVNETGLQVRFPTGDFSNGSPTVSNVSSFTGIKVGMYIQDAGGASGGTEPEPVTAGTYVPAETTITAFDSGAGTITMSANATGTTTGIDIAIGDVLTIDSVPFYGVHSDVTNVYAGSGEFATTKQEFAVGDPTATVDKDKELDTAAVSIALSLNGYHAEGSSPTPPEVRAYVVDGDFSTAGPATIVFEEIGIGGSGFTISCTRPQAFSPELGSSGLSSTAESRPGRVFYSDPDEPEAVPLLNYIDIGDPSKEILALTPLEQSMLVWKEDGVFRITGVPLDSWTLDSVDRSVRLLHPDAWTVLDNRVFALTDRGVVVIGDSGGARVISQAISEELRAYTENYGTTNNRGAGTWAVANQELGLVIFAVASASANHTSAVWYVHHTATGSWSQWARTDRHAIYVPDINALYTAPAVDAWKLHSQRPLTDPAATDVQIGSLSVTVSGTTVSITQTDVDPYTPAVGDVVLISGSYARATAVVDGGSTWDVTVDATLSQGSQTATWYQSFAIAWEYNGPPPSDVQRFWQILNVHLQGVSALGSLGATAEVGASADDSTATTTTTTLDTSVTRSKGVRVGLPLEVCRAAHIYPRVSMQAAGVGFACEGVTLEHEPIGTRVER